MIQLQAQICYFSILPFETYLGDIFSGILAGIVVLTLDNIILIINAEHWATLQYPFCRQTHPTCMKDTHDSEEYTRLMQPGEFLSVPEHTGLILCSDGVLLFKSSGRLSSNLLYS